MVCIITKQVVDQPSYTNVDETATIYQRLQTPFNDFRKTRL